MSLKEYINKLQSQGIYSFNKKDAEKQLNLTKNTLKRTLLRYCIKKRITKIRKGFYIIIPIEYYQKGILPTYWFIDDLMKYIRVRYYVGLLSAAALHGASHQQPQISQVIISNQIRDIKVKGIKIKFFVKKNIKMNNFILDKKTETGIIKISAPSLTAIDLIKYVNKIGGWNNIATIIAELNEKIDPKQIIEITENEKSLTYIQKLGYLLELIGDTDKSNILNKFIKNKNTNPIPLDSSIPIKNNNLNNKWNIYINRDIEIDEL